MQAEVQDELAVSKTSVLGPRPAPAWSAAPSDDGSSSSPGQVGEPSRKEAIHGLEAMGFPQERVTEVVSQLEHDGTALYTDAAVQLLLVMGPDEVVVDDFELPSPNPPADQFEANPKKFEGLQAPQDESMPPSYEAATGQLDDHHQQQPAVASVHPLHEPLHRPDFHGNSTSQGSHNSNNHSKSSHHAWNLSNPEQHQQPHFAPRHYHYAGGGNSGHFRRQHGVHGGHGVSFPSFPRQHYQPLLNAAAAPYQPQFTQPRTQQTAFPSPPSMPPVAEFLSQLGLSYLADSMTRNGIDVLVLVMTLLVVSVVVIVVVAVTWLGFCSQVLTRQSHL